MIDELSIEFITSSPLRRKIILIIERKFKGGKGKLKENLIERGPLLSFVTCILTFYRKTEFANLLINIELEIEDSEKTIYRYRLHSRARKSALSPPCKI